MANIQELDNAIGAHGMWKIRLKTAVETGKIDADIETIRKDNECAFGKWLYGTTLSAADKSTDHYKSVLALHSNFHKMAAKVAELAINGKKAEAEKMLALGGEYSNLSVQLTRAMMEWKKVSK